MIGHGRLYNSWWGAKLRCKHVMLLSPLKIWHAHSCSSDQPPSHCSIGVCPLPALSLSVCSWIASRKSATENPYTVRRTNCVRGKIIKTWVLVLKEYRSSPPSSTCNLPSSAKLVHTRRALSNTITNSRQEPVLGQACNSPDPHKQFIFLWWGV